MKQTTEQIKAELVAAAIKIIADATKEAAATIASAALDASKKLASDAAEASKVANIKGQDDHDLLIRVDTKLEILMGDVKTLNKDVDSNIKKLTDSVDKQIGEHEKRIIALESSKGIQTILTSIGTGLLLLLSGLLIYHLFKIPI